MGCQTLFSGNGTEQPCKQQFIKGLLFLFSEIAFLIAFAVQIIPAIGGMITLGTQEQGEAIKKLTAWKSPFK